MSAKKTTKKTVPPSNVVIINPETEEVEKSSDGTPASPKGSFKTFPTPTQPAGKGQKYCPSCNDKIGARSTVCKNCGHEFVKGAAKPAGARLPKAPKTITQHERPEINLLRVLKGRGFEVRVSVDALDPNATPEIHVEKSIERIMDYVPYYNTSGRFEIGLDQLLTMMKLPLNK